MYSSLSLYTHPRPSNPVPDSLHQPQTLIPIPDVPYPLYAIEISSSTPHFHLKPFIPIPIRFHTSNDPHTHQSLQYPSQILHTHLKSLTPIAGPPHPTKALTCISGLLYLILSLQTIPWSFTHNLGPPTQSHTSDSLHTHQNLQYPYQILHTHLKPLTPISGPPHPNKTLHTHIRPSILILGLHTITWPFTTTLGPPHQSQALLTHPTPSNPSQTFHITLCHPD